MNPCPCGWRGHASGRCNCTPDQVARYRSRVSGALLDRIDIGVEVPALSADALDARSGNGESSTVVRERVRAARAVALARQSKPNAQLTPREIDVHCLPDNAGAALAASALARLSLSARGYHRILKVARTIADLNRANTIGASHVAEAVAYRRFERG
jgi:magnesium chelatase family protein